MTRYIGNACPHCRRDLRVRAEYIGQRVACNHCGGTFEVPAPIADEPVVSTPGERPPGRNGSHPGVPAMNHAEAADGSTPPSQTRGSATNGSPRTGPDAGGRLGDYELLEEMSRDDMIAVYSARDRRDGRVVTLRVESEVLGNVPPPQPPHADAPADLPPLEIPGYRIIETLRDGAMGRVYRARQSSVDRVVAIKVLHDRFARKPEYVERLRREARMTARLSHGHIVQAIDAGEAGGHHFLVTEFIDGETVQDRLDRHEVFDEAEALAIVVAVTEALAHVQRRGLVHRDVKPANVVLGADGVVKLIDLGLARPVDDPDWAVAEAGMAVGTPEYISPEQVRGQTDIDIRSDLYSLGASLYHMVTGQVPYPGATSAEVMRKHLDRDHPLVPPEQINPQLSHALGSVISVLLATNREDRYRDPDELLVDLKRLLQGESPAFAEQGSFRGPFGFAAGDDPE